MHCLWIKVWKVYSICLDGARLETLVTISWKKITQLQSPFTVNTPFTLFLSCMFYNCLLIKIRVFAKNENAFHSEVWHLTRCRRILYVCVSTSLFKNLCTLTSIHKCFWLDPPFHTPCQGFLYYTVYSWQKIHTIYIYILLTLKMAGWKRMRQFQFPL